MRIKSDHAGISPALQELKKNETESVRTKTATAEPAQAVEQDAVAVDTEPEAQETPQTYNAKGVAAEGKVPRGLLVALRNHLAKEGAELPPGLAKQVQRLGVVDSDSDGKLTVNEIESFASARVIKLPALAPAPVTTPVEVPADSTEPTTTPEVPAEGASPVTPEVPSAGPDPIGLPTTEVPVVDPVLIPVSDTPTTDPAAALPEGELPVVAPDLIADPLIETPAQPVLEQPSLIPSIVAGDTSVDQTLVEQLLPEVEQTV